MRGLTVFLKACAYLNRYASRLKCRYCAKMHPDIWYRTFGRINYSMLRAAKILRG